MATDLTTPGDGEALLQGVWRAQDTSPPEIEAGLRNLLKERHDKDSSHVPARVLNLVAVVDKDWRGEIENRLERLGRYHPSRTIICAVEEGRTSLDAWAVVSDEGDPGPGGIVVCTETLELTVGAEHLPHLDTIVAPLVVTDLSTVVWSPHGHPEAVDSLARLADVVLIDSVMEPDSQSALARTQQLAQQAYVVDLAWLRSTPWRERVCSAFDPPRARPALREISGITVRHNANSGVAALLYVGWLASRLGWETAPLVAQGGVLHGKVRARKHEITVHLEPEEMQVPGLCGLTVETASGISLTLERGEGGLRARRRTRRGTESEWTILGASRGESGILGEGVRQALLRDPTYTPAAAAARDLLA